MIEIKPFPFCGSSSQTAFVKDFDGYYRKQNQKEAQACALEHWNRRTR